MNRKEQKTEKENDRNKETKGNKIKGKEIS